MYSVDVRYIDIKFLKIIILSHTLLTIAGTKVGRAKIDRDTRQGRFTIASKGDLFCFNYTLGMLWEEMMYMVHHDWQDAVYRSKPYKFHVYSLLYGIYIYIPYIEYI